MDKVTFLGGHPPPPPTSSPPRPSSADQKIFPKKEQQHEPEEEDDAEVMQVVANGPAVCLRTKKQRIIGVNGVVTTEDDGNIERPMSWEGELSDDEIVVDPKRTPPPPHITGCHIMPTVISTTTLPARPLGSPMCMEDEGHLSSITRIKVRMYYLHFFFKVLLWTCSKLLKVYTYCWWNFF